MPWGIPLVALATGFVVGLMLAAVVLTTRNRRQLHAREIHWSRRVNDAQSDRDQAREHSARALEEAQSREQRLRKALAESEETLTLLSEEKLPAFEVELQRRNETIASLEHQAAVYRARLADANDELTQLRHSQQQAQLSIREKTALGESLDQQLEALRRQLQTDQARIAGLETELQKLQDAAVQREQHMRELRSRSAAVEELRSVRQKQSRLLSQTQQELQRAQLQLEQYRGELLSARQQCDQYEQQAKELRNAADSAAANHDRVLETLHIDHSRQLRQMQGRLEELEQQQHDRKQTIGRLRQELLDYEQRLPTYESELRKRDEQIAAIREEFSSLRERLPQLNDALRERETAINDLVSELTRQRERYAALRQNVAKQEQPEANKPAQVIRLQPHLQSRSKSPRPAMCLEEAPGNPDNLQLIRGIGPVLEKRLNKLGLFHFEQLAKLSEQDIAWLDTHLNSVVGRIQRDEWIAQARDLQRNSDQHSGG